MSRVGAERITDWTRLSSATFAPVIVATVGSVAIDARVPVSCAVASFVVVEWALVIAVLPAGSQTVESV